MTGIIQERHRYKINPMHAIPDCWYHDGRGRRTPTVEESQMVEVSL